MIKNTIKKRAQKIRKRLKLDPLLPDARYTYFFKLCLRPPQSLMKSVFTKFSTSQTPGVDNKSVLAQKFMSAFAESIGALPSDKDLEAGIPVGTNFRLGETGITLEVDVRSPRARPTPQNLRAKNITKGAQTEQQHGTSFLFVLDNPATLLLLLVA